MTDMANAEAATAGTSTAADATAAQGSESAGSGDWLTGLRDEGNRQFVTSKGWKDFDALVKSTQDGDRRITELTAQNEKALVLPGDDAKPEQWNDFWNKVGRPEKAEAYEFKLPEGLPADLPYDSKSADEFKNWAHEAGLSPRQAQVVHDRFVQRSAEGVQAQLAAQETAAKASHEELTKAWGEPSSEDYKRNVALADRAIRQNGGAELLAELRDVGAVGPNGEVLKPKIGNLLARVGKALYAEDTVYGGPSTAANPFSDKSENMTDQGKIIRDDPNHARALIRAAGKSPLEWGL